MIFPKDFHLPEMDVNLDIRRVLTEKLPYDACSLKATIRCDRTAASRFQFALGKSSFNGEATLDLVRQPPVLGLRFSANRLETEAAGTRLALAGRLVFPLRKRGLRHRLALSGNRLDSLEPLLNVSLPPWGPYEMTGVIRVRPEGYSLSDATVAIGDSRFLGQIYIETAAARPKVTVNLEATTM